VWSAASVPEVPGLDVGAPLDETPNAVAS
jgi:hypothetical protein